MFSAGLIQPNMLPDGQVCVDMGEPILSGSKVPTTLAPTQGNAVVGQTLTVDGRDWLMTCVSMGNPHAITFGTSDGADIKVSGLKYCFVSEEEKGRLQEPSHGN